MQAKLPCTHMTDSKSSLALASKSIKRCRRKLESRTRLRPGCIAYLCCPVCTSIASCRSLNSAVGRRRETITVCSHPVEQRKVLVKPTGAYVAVILHLHIHANNFPSSNARHVHSGGKIRKPIHHGLDEVLQLAKLAIVCLSFVACVVALRTCRDASRRYTQRGVQAYSAKKNSVVLPVDKPGSRMLPVSSLVLLENVDAPHSTFKMAG